MATKNTTKQVVGEDWEMVPWHVILKNRVHDLAMDEDHTLTYGDRDRVSPATSRTELVHIYETAYSELAESFVGHLEHIEELEADVANLRKNLERQQGYSMELEDMLESTVRQLGGLLSLIEQPARGLPPRPSFTNPDQYQAMQTR